MGQRGGGLALLGGPRSFGPGGYAPTPLAPALGVRIDGGMAYSDVPVKAVSDPETGGLPPLGDIERHPDFPGWPLLPLLDGVNPVAGVRAGASVPLRTDSGRALVTIQRYGGGRTLCLLTGSTSRWVLSRDATDASRRGHGVFWRTLVVWLATPPNRAPVALETPGLSPSR